MASLGQSVCCWNVSCRSYQQESSVIHNATTNCDLELNSKGQYAETAPGFESHSSEPRYKKILEIGPIGPPHNGWAVRIDYVLEALTARGIECAALDVGPNRKVKRPGCDDVQSAWDYGRKVFSYLRKGYRIHTHLNAQSGKAYVLVLFSTICSWCVRRPAVLTWHGGLEQRWFPRTKNPFVWLAHRIIFGLSDYVICNDDLLKSDLIACGASKNRVVAIAAFSKQYLEFTAVALDHDLQTFIDSHSPCFYCYTAFRPEFHLSTLLEALTKLRQCFSNYGMVIVGFTEGSQSFQDGIRQNGIADNVLFAGDLDRNEFLTLTTKSDLCIRTPKRDGISSSVLETLALGTPVVAAANPLRPSEVVTYEAEDADGLVEAVRKVMVLSPDERRPTGIDIPDTVGEEIAVLTGAR